MLIKRLFDIFLSAAGLILLSPVFLIVLLLVWLHDGCSPVYISFRAGYRNTPFKMYKIRSMVVNASASGVDSTGNNDSRITPIGHFIRRYKIDELSQLLNVLLGDMSLVGPRPNVLRETSLYTAEESRLLSVKPGITDFASIVFSDEGKILENTIDPDLSYHQLIRPGKSRLGLFYIDHLNPILDCILIFITLESIFSRRLALRHIVALLTKYNCSPSLISLASRSVPLIPTPPPGASSIVFSRDII